MAELTDKERRALDVIKRYRADFSAFARDHLKIRPKDPLAPLVPLAFNRPQQYIHERLEEQKARTGKVRAIILKGRQQGSSTYVGGRSTRAHHFSRAFMYTS
ncbi:MAG: hypothetical protein HC888_16140 [Candidatus Competibacteraceae bacterium]|nr:hypothetical protein [Candidatus Competibacteraceae bacterium]